LALRTHVSHKDENPTAQQMAKRMVSLKRDLVFPENFFALPSVVRLKAVFFRVGEEPETKR